MSSNNSQSKVRFWPIFILAFLYPINLALVSLAIPLYFYSISITTEIIGFISAAGTISYSFSPLLFSKISDRIGRKKAIIMSIIGISITQSLFYITLHPILFFIARLMEGLFMGLYWPNLASSISDNSGQDQNKYMSRYNFSWNGGVLIGFLAGGFITFFITETLIIFYISPLFTYICFFISLFLKKSDKKRDNDEEEKVNIISISKKSGVKGELVKIEKSSFLKTKIPLVIPISLILVFSISKGTLNFLYPIKSEIMAFPEYSVYFLSFLGIGTQTFSVSFSSHISKRFLKPSIPISIFIIAITIILFNLVNFYFLYLALYLLIGFFSGFCYSISLKLFLTINIQKSTGRYAGILESLTGIGFLLTQISTGFIALISIELAFLIISVFIFTLLGILLTFLKKLFNPKIKNERFK